MSWLFVRPVFDEVTEITYDEAQDAIDYLREKGAEVVDLAKEEAVRENVERVLEERPDINLAHYDHGSEDRIWGNDDRPVIDLKNVGLLREREAYNNNCSSAKKLGVEAWKQNCKAFWGYSNIFYFTTDALEEFKEAVNYGIKSRVDGLSWKECLEKTKEKMTELADKLVKAGKALAASCMRHDRDIMVCYTKDMPPEEPTCPFSRLIVKVFGQETLRRLRKVRERLVGFHGKLREGTGYFWLFTFGVLIFATVIDHIVNSTLYKFGLVFSWEWFNAYGLAWTLLFIFIGFRGVGLYWFSKPKPSKYFAFLIFLTTIAMWVGGFPDFMWFLMEGTLPPPTAVWWWMPFVNWFHWEWTVKEHAIYTLAWLAGLIILWSVKHTLAKKGLRTSSADLAFSTADRRRPFSTPSQET